MIFSRTGKSAGKSLGAADTSVHRATSGHRVKHQVPAFSMTTNGETGILQNCREDLITGLLVLGPQVEAPAAESISSTIE